jgi:hypothetical protein
MSGEGPEIRARCALEPDLKALPKELRNRLHWKREPGILVLRGSLDSSDARALRDCHADRAEWQRAVDDLVVQDRVAQQTQVSRFPSTMWGRLLVDLRSNDDEQWRSFIASYRTPIRKVICRLIGPKAVDGRAASTLADDFFGWFFEKRIHQRVSRVDADGHVNRFRGYLKACIRTYLREEVHRFQATPEPPEQEASDQDISQAIDLEICREAVEGELAVLRRDAYPIFMALVDDFRGRTLAEVADRLRRESGGESGSITTAYGQRKRAREAFRRRLIQYRLRQGAVTEEDALQEYRELIPFIADVLVELVEKLPVDEPGR